MLLKLTRFNHKKIFLKTPNHVYKLTLISKLKLIKNFLYPIIQFNYFHLILQLKYQYHLF
jgi:hypothetical protein